MNLNSTVGDLVRCTAFFCFHVVTDTRNVRNRLFYFGLFSVRFFQENSDLVWKEFCSVPFKKMRFGLDVLVIYYSCNS